MTGIRRRKGKGQESWAVGGETW